MERSFEQALREKRGYIIQKMRSDGACLFRAVGKNFRCATCTSSSPAHCEGVTFFFVFSRPGVWRSRMSWTSSRSLHGLHGEDVEPPLGFFPEVNLLDWAACYGQVQDVWLAHRDKIFHDATEQLENWGINDGLTGITANGWW